MPTQFTPIVVANENGDNVITPSPGNFALFVAETAPGVFTVFSKHNNGDVNPLKVGAVNLTITLTP